LKTAVKAAMDGQRPPCRALNALMESKTFYDKLQRHGIDRQEYTGTPG
jgi:MOSC domain-containing protein YiiM